MADADSQAGREESVADVAIDALYYEEERTPPAQPAQPAPDGGIVLAFAQPPAPEAAQPAPEAPPEGSPPRRRSGAARTGRAGARPGAKTRTGQGQGRKKRMPFQKRERESTLRKIVTAPIRAVNKISSWVMGSHIDRRNPLLVTLRMFTVLFPIIISMYVSHLGMQVMFPGSGSGWFADKNETRLVTNDSRKPVIQVGSKKLIIPLPDEFEIIGLDEYRRRFPLVDEVAKRDGFHITFAARRTDAENSVYYLNVGVTADHAALGFNEASFAKMLRDLMRIREAGSMVQMGPNQSDIPFDVTKRSACFGRMASVMELQGSVRVTKETLRQYSCIFYAKGKAVTINLGYAYRPADSDGGDATWCFEAIQAWRDRLLEEYK